VTTNPPKATMHNEKHWKMVSLKRSEIRPATAMTDVRLELAKIIQQKKSMSLI
jgi:hypothetical protein